ncbi:MAG: hypothetical protein KIG72_05270 [Bradymonadales bacterium]|nr:hypothetical protein [Bradymonadales bacterium]
MKKSSLRNVLFWGLVACCSPIASCYAPENIVIEYDNAANGEVYQFDIMVLSEWGGHILPERESLYIYANQSNVYDLSSFSATTEGTLYYKGEPCDGGKCVVIDELGTAVSDLGVTVNNAGSAISFKPYPLLDHLNIVCNDVSDETDKDAELLAKAINDKLKPSEPIAAYRCDYVSGGAIPMRKTWDSLKSDSGSKTQVYVGNGDSFGVSQAASATFNDLPTPQILSLMGLNVDTFGNHNFDKRMAYLSPLIEMATSGNDDERYRYEYVASNLDDKSEGKKWLTHYNVAVSSDDSESEKLRVAFVGALDSSIISTTKAGALGSLSIDSEMCSVINELEEAYNENARAFFILGHILTGSDSFINLMNAIFSLTKPVIGDSVSSGKTESGGYEYKCNSKIVVPVERLEAEFGTRSVAKIDLSKQENKKKYAAIIDSIRLEIFEGIIGVIGEATADPSVVAYYSDQANHIPEYGLKWEMVGKEGTQNTTSKDLIADHDLTASKGKGIMKPCTNQLLASGYCVQLHFPNKVENSVDHPIYYIQIQGQGSHTLRLTAKAVKNADVHNGSGVAAAYRSQADTLAIVPVMAPLNDVIVQVGNHSPSNNSNVIDLSNPNYEACLDLIQSVDASLKTYHSEHNSKHTDDNKIKEYNTSCEDYFKGIAKIPQVYTSVNAIESTDVIEQGGNTYHPAKVYKSYSDCQSVFSPYIVAKTSQEDDNRLALASSFWACMNSATSSISCKEATNEFVYPNIFVFDHYVASTMNEDRSHTTYNTNIIATGYFNYIVAAEKDVAPDLGIINSGTMREGDFRSLNAQNLAQTVPFENKLQYISVPMTALVPIIEKALAKGLSEANSDFGGFPSVTRMVIAYKDNGVNDADKNDKNDTTPQANVEITEIWKTDQYGVFTDLLYLRDADQSFFAKYKVNGTSIEAEFDSVPWLCNIGGELTACQDNIYTFSKIEKINESDETKNLVKGYYNNGSFNVLTHSFLMSGGDGYRAYFGQSLNDVNDCEQSLRPAIFSYYSGSKGSFSDNGIVDVDSVCAGVNDYETYDGLSPEKLNCILYLNHFYRVGGPNESPKTRWIDDTSDAVRGELNSMCLPDSFD